MMILLSVMLTSHHLHHRIEGYETDTCRTLLTSGRFFGNKWLPHGCKMKVYEPEYTSKDNRCYTHTSGSRPPFRPSGPICFNRYHCEQWQLCCPEKCPETVIMGVQYEGHQRVAALAARRHFVTEDILRSVASALLEETQRIRQKHLATACARMVFKKSTIVAPDWSEVYVDDDRRYVYCLVSKVSCTSWKRTLLWMTGKVPSRFSNMSAIPIGYIHNHKNNDQVMNRMIKLAKPEVERRLYGGNYYKFMFVREPLDRLVSAYRDKVLSDPAYPIDEYIHQYIRNKRPAVNNITEQSLISRPLSQAGSLSPRIHTDKNQTATKEPNVTEAMPTFAEFIDYVLAQRTAGKRLDRHWLPQSELCSPCLVNYDFIGHQESLHADAEYVLDILRNRRRSNSTTKPLPSKYTDIKFPDSDASHGYEMVELERRRLKRKDKSDRAVNKMLAQLNDVTLRRIVDLYDADYQLFGFKRPARLNTR